MSDTNPDLETGAVIKPEVLESDDVKAAIAAAVAEAVKETTEGLEANRDAILQEKRELAERLKQAEEQAKKFEGIDVDKIKTMLDSVEKSEEAKLIAEGKIDEVIAARTNSVKTAYEQQFQEKDNEIRTLAEEKQKIQQMYETKLIGDAIQAEALKQGMLPEAINDAIINANGLFKIGDDGSVQAAKMDEFINSPERFVKALKETKPYYWPSNADFRMSGSGGNDPKDIVARIETAAQSGDFEAYKALRKKQAG